MPSPASPMRQTTWPRPRWSVLHRVAHLRHLAIPSDERRADALDAAQLAGPGLRRQHAIRADGGALALHVDPAQVFEIEDRRNQPLRVLRDLDRAGLGRLLHARGEVHRVPHGRVFGHVLRADVADDHRAGVDADAHREVQAVLAFDLLREGFDLVQDLQRREDRPLRIVLVRGGGAEEREERVAHEPGHRPLVALDRSGQDREGAVHHLPPILRIQPLGEGGRSDDVTEQRGDDPPLSRRGRGFRRAQDVQKERRLVRRPDRPERVPAVHAEPGVGDVFRLAAGTNHVGRRRTHDSSPRPARDQPSRPANQALPLGGASARKRSTAAASSPAGSAPRAPRA